MKVKLIVQTVAFCTLFAQMQANEAYKKSINTIFTNNLSGNIKIMDTKKVYRMPQLSRWTSIIAGLGISYALSTAVGKSRKHVERIVSRIRKKQTEFNPFLYSIIISAALSKTVHSGIEKLTRFGYKQLAPRLGWRGVVKHTHRITTMKKLLQMHKKYRYSEALSQVLTTWYERLKQDLREKKAVVFVWQERFEIITREENKQFYEAVGEKIAGLINEYEKTLNESLLFELAQKIQSFTSSSL